MGIKELNWKNKAVPNDRKYTEPFPTTVCLFSPLLLRTALLCSCSMLEEWWLLHVRLCWAADMVPGGGSYRQYNPHLYGDSSALHQGWIQKTFSWVSKDCQHNPTTWVRASRDIIDVTPQDFKQTTAAFCFALLPSPRDCRARQMLDRTTILITVQYFNFPWDRRPL